MKRKETVSIKGLASLLVASGSIKDQQVLKSRAKLGDLLSRIRLTAVRETVRAIFAIVSSRRGHETLIWR